MADDHENNATGEEPHGVSDRSGQPARPERAHDLQQNAAAEPTPTQDPNERLAGEDMQHAGAEFSPFIAAQFLSKLEQHIHTPQLIPNPEIVAQARETAPELYTRILDTIDVNNRVYEEGTIRPLRDAARYAARGQYLALIVVLAVLVLCAYLAHLGYAAASATVAAIDLVALAGVFMQAKSVYPEPRENDQPSEQGND